MTHWRGLSWLILRVAILVIKVLKYSIIGWEMAQWVKCLPHKYEDLNLDPQSPYKKSDVESVS